MAVSSKSVALRRLPSAMITARLTRFFELPNVYQASDASSIARRASGLKVSPSLPLSQPHAAEIPEQQAEYHFTAHGTQAD